MINNSDWLVSPPNLDCLPFYPCWVTNGKNVFLASWLEAQWEIGKGLAYDNTEITHFQYLKAPKPPLDV